MARLLTLLALTLALLTPLANSSAQPVDHARPATTARSTVGQHEDVLIPTPTGRVRAPLDSARLSAYRIRKWPTLRIPYYETIPAKWQWALDDAIKRWHLTGAKIRFVKVSSASKARLLIQYGETYGADGIGTLGYNPWGKNILHLSTSYKTINAYDPTMRAWAARLFAHELGHNLGYDHVSGTCQLMVPVFTIGGSCGPLTDTPGWYRCDYIDKTLRTRHVRWYGGSAQAGPRACLFEKVPSAVQELKATGGTAAEDSRVTLTWSNLRPPTGGRVRLLDWSSTSCSPVSNDARVRHTALPATRWTDPDRRGGPWCYGVQLVNRYGAPGPVRTVAVQRTRQRPAAPVITATRWDGERGQYVVRATLPPGTTLGVASTDTGVCPGPDDQVLPVYADAGEWFLNSAWAPATCMVVYALDDIDPALSSLGVTLHLSRPAPTKAPILSAITAAADGEYIVTVSEPEPGAGFRPYVTLVEGACPTTMPTDQGNYAWGWGEVRVWPWNSGPHCIVAASTDDFDRLGPITTRAFNVPAATASARSARTRTASPKPNGTHPNATHRNQPRHADLPLRTNAARES